MTTRRRPQRVEVVLAEGLVVGPDDILVIKVGDGSLMDEEAVADMNRTLVSMGLERRALIMVGDVEIGKVESG